jgi:co-chaperonin GroES (HSP10)
MKENMNIKPMKKKVLIAQNKDTVKTESGIILEDAASVRESRTGTVLEIGPQVTVVTIGDKVLLEWNKAQVVKIGDAQRVIIEEEFIVAVVES